MDYLDPATGDTIGSLTPLTGQDVLVAHAHSLDAWEKWRKVPIDIRISHLLKGQQWLIQNMNTVIDAISLNNGKPKTESMMADVAPVIWCVNYLADRAPKILKSKKISVKSWMPWKHATKHFRPLGVVGIISPWNYPFSIPMGEVLTALVAGNCVLLKPSEVTSEVNKMIQAFFDACDLPKNVFQMIEGNGLTGAALSKLPLARIVFTGSVETGKKVMRSAAENLTPVSLELGGKDPAIVLQDADLDVASSGVVVGGYFNNGQTCCSIERLLVHESIADKFTALVQSKIAKLRVGPSTAYSNEIGPFTYEAQKQVLKTQLDELGNPYASSLYDGKSNFMVPALIKAHSKSRIWKEESFGPILVYDTFKTDEEAIQKANDTDFGLGAVIWSGNMDRAQKLAKEIRAGTVVINDAPHTHALFALPWGGLKNSGIGRVHGEMGLHEMSHQQIIASDLLGQWKQFWWFPYSKDHFQFLKEFSLYLAHRNPFKKIQHLLRCFAQYFKLEKRL